MTHLSFVDVIVRAHVRTANHHDRPHEVPGVHELVPDRRLQVTLVLCDPFPEVQRLWEQIPIHPLQALDEFFFLCVRDLEFCISGRFGILGSLAATAFAGPVGRSVGFGQLLHELVCSRHQEASNNQTNDDLSSTSTSQWRDIPLIRPTIAALDRGSELHGFQDLSTGMPPGDPIRSILLSRLATALCDDPTAV